TGASTLACRFVPSLQTGPLGRSRQPRPGSSPAPPPRLRRTQCRPALVPPEPAPVVRARWPPAPPDLARALAQWRHPTRPLLAAPPAPDAPRPRPGRPALRGGARAERAHLADETYSGFRRAAAGPGSSHPL